MSDSFSTTTLATTAASVVLVPVVWNTLGGLLRNSITSKITILNDIPKLGGASKRSQKIRGTAVVCGGSIAGLWTARVCADHFERVVVVEPEAWVAPNQGIDIHDYVATELREKDGTRSIINKRTRVWQYHGTHAFQPLAVRAFRQLFPNFDEEVREMGIALVPGDMHTSLGGLPIIPPYSEYEGEKIPEALIASRPYFETLLRTLVRKSDACKNVEFVTGTATGVVAADGDSNKLSGVHVRLDGHNEPTVIPAELVIDCTGSSQAGFKWLPRAGFGSPNPSQKDQPALSDLRIEYDQRMSYMCFQYFLTPEMNARLSTLFPPHKDSKPNAEILREGWDKAGWLFAHMPIPECDNKIFMGKKAEGNRVELAFGGWAVDPLPRTNADILEFLDSLVLLPGCHIPKWIVEFLHTLCGEGEAEPVTGVYPAPASSYIQYQKAQNMPSNFVAIGDASMKLNPVFAQGCSKACIGAVSLNSVLANVQSDSIPKDFGKGFFDLQDARINGFWMQVKGQDYRYETTQPVSGEEKEMEKMLQSKGGFMGSLMTDMAKLAFVDEHVRSTLWHVFSMLAPPTDLFAPSILSRWAWAKLRGTV